MSVPDPNATLHTVPSTDSPSTKDQIVTALQALIALLGLIGVNVPPIFTNLAVEQQVASVILLVVPLVMLGYHKLVTSPARANAAANASAHASVAASRPVALRLAA